MRTTIDLINLFLSILLQSEVPKSVWIGRDVSYDYSRIFGYKAFIHIPKDERSKLNRKSKQCIFLNYAYEEFRYRLWDLVGKKIIRSKNIVFLEDQIIEDFEKIKKPKSVIRYYMDLGLVPPTMMNNDNGGDIQNDDIGRS